MNMHGVGEKPVLDDFLLGYLAALKWADENLCVKK